MQNIAEQHSRDLKRIESTLRGLQWRMTQHTNGLVQRVEALERPTKGKGSREMVVELARGCHKDTSIGTEVLATSFADLEARFQSFSSETVANMDSCTTALAELRTQTRDGPSILPDKDLQVCIENASNFVLRLENMCAKWTDLQNVQGCIGSTDQLQETIKDSVAPGMKELLPEVNGGHGLHNPRLGEESRTCCGSPQPTSSLGSSLDTLCHTSETLSPAATMLLRTESAVISSAFM